MSQETARGHSTDASGRVGDSIYGQIKEVKDGGKLVHLATAGLDGKPNIVPMRFARHAADDVLVIADMYFCKTRVNLKENPNLALSVAFPERESCPVAFYGHGWLAEKGTGGRLGEYWSNWRNWGEENPPTEVPEGFGPPNPSCRAVLVIDVDRVCSCAWSDFGEEVAS
ncbi:MAG: pyridoxamine 5'-phosphate oxidase family protein [Armatimonadota bacterium]|jgi:hypothetical protein